MIKTICITILLLCTSGAALAEGNYKKPIIHTQSTHQYMVSAMLRKNDQGATVKLIQSIEKASSEAEASGLLLSRIKVEFVGYSVLDSITTIVPESKNSCENWI